ncbi:hypothetical protein [Colwellia sp. UCD-KL20]|nr:hypothetical protein [Colwellia sp. UCD-KL20]
MFYTLLEILDKKFNFVTVAAKQTKHTGDNDKSAKTMLDKGVECYDSVRI